MPNIILADWTVTVSQLKRNPHAIGKASSRCRTSSYRTSGLGNRGVKDKAFGLVALDRHAGLPAHVPAPPRINRSMGGVTSAASVLRMSRLPFQATCGLTK